MGRRIDPEVAVAEMQAAGVEPLEPYPASNAPWRSRCHTCGNEVSPRLNDIRQGGGACWFCAGKAPTDPETARREFAEAGVEMIGDFTYTNVPTLCRCMTCGKEVSPRLNSIRSGRGACLFCSGKAPVDPETARREFAEAGVEMIGDFTNTHTPTLCRCTTCGKEVSPRLTSIRQGQGPCLFCGEGGFDGTLPGSVYLLRHDGHGALKVGITNDRIGRLAQHEREGWSLIDLWSFDLGANAEAVENAVLAAWKKHPHGVAAEDMPQRGHTETVSFDDVTEAEALHLIEMAVVDIPVGATGERTR